MTAPAGLLQLLEERDADGTTQYNRLKKFAQSPTWSHFKRLIAQPEWLDALGDSGAWTDGVAPRKVTDFAGEADAADASELKAYTPVKRVALMACLVHKARLRVRSAPALMFCKRVGSKTKTAKEELEALRLAEREKAETLIGNYRTVLKHLDDGGPAQKAVAKAAVMTAEAAGAFQGLDEQAPAEAVARRLEGKVSPAVIAVLKAMTVQAGRLGTVTRAVEAFGGFAKEHERIEKVSAHHGNFWEVLLYGQLGRDRALMFDLTGKLEFGGMGDRSRGPGPCLPVSDRAHQTVRRVQHPRTRHQAGGVPPETRRRLRSPTRAGSDQHRLHRSGLTEGEDP